MQINRHSFSPECSELCWFSALLSSASLPAHWSSSSGWLAAVSSQPFAHATPSIDDLMTPAAIWRLLGSEKPKKVRKNKWIHCLWLLQIRWSVNLFYLRFDHFGLLLALGCATNFENILGNRFCIAFRECLFLSHFSESMSPDYCSLTNWAAAGSDERRHRINRVMCVNAGEVLLHLQWRWKWKAHF